MRLILNANVVFSQIYISKKWGFTKWDREDYEDMRATGKLQPDGVNVQVHSLPCHIKLSILVKTFFFKECVFEYFIYKNRIFKLNTTTGPIGLQCFGHKKDLLIQKIIG